MKNAILSAILSVLAVLSSPATAGAAESGAAPVVLNDNGGWCWFQDERAIVKDGLLVIGSVANRRGTDGARRHGSIEVTCYDLNARAVRGTAVLHANLQDDDHDAPAFLVRPDGRLLAVYSKHGNDKLVRYRISTNPGDPLSWEPEKTIERGAAVTYSNLFRLARENGGKGRVYNFYRGEGWNPNYLTSDDDGATWTYGGKLLEFPGRPYLRYASNGTDEIHFMTTEHHPRNYDNSIYHGYIKAGKVHRSDGTAIKGLGQGPIKPSEATKVFSGDPDNVGWTADMHLDAEGRPWIGYSVQKNKDTNDLRYRYARWDGKRWNDHEIAHAGSALYASEADYSGLIALDPADPATVYISTNAEPASGKPLVSAADGRRHYELFKGVTKDGGATFSWTPVTANSTEDNIRPVVPIGVASGSILLWLRGKMTAYTDYDLDVVGLIAAKR